MAQLWLQFGLHDSLYQIKSDSVSLPHYSREDQISIPIAMWTFYQIQSLELLSIINFLCPRGKSAENHFRNGFRYLFSWVVQRGPEQ